MEFVFIAIVYFVLFVLVFAFLVWLTRFILGIHLIIHHLESANKELERINYNLSKLHMDSNIR